MSAVYGTIAGPCDPLEALLRTVTDTPTTFMTLDDRWRPAPDVGDPGSRGDRDVGRG